MPRRSLPVVAATAAAFVLVPGTASATPDQAAVENYYGASHYGVAEIRLPDGRLAAADLSENQAENRTDRRGFLSLRITTPCSPAPCIPRTASGVLDLTDEQVTFGQRLRTASVEGVTITLTTPGLGGWGGGLPPTGGPPSGGGFPSFPPEPWTPPVVTPPHSEDVVVSLAFIGTGELTHDVEHVYGPCGDGSTDCQTLWVNDAREASVVLTIDGETGEPGAGRLTYSKGIQSAAPKPVYGEY